MSTRQNVLQDYIRRWNRETSASMATIATNIRETYHAMVPECGRVVQFSNKHDAYQRSRLDAQTLQRLFDSEHGFPLDLEDAALLAMPDRYRQDCINELAARIGQHTAPMAEDETSTFDTLANIAKEVAGVIDAMAPALADGRFTPADRAYAARIKKEVNDLHGALCAVVREIDTKVLNLNVRQLHARPATPTDTAGV